MNRFFTKSIALIALVGAFVAVPAVKSEAAFVAWICNDALCAGGDDVFANDGGAGDALPGLVGAILFSPVGGYGGYEITINTSQSKPVLGSGMDLSYVVTRIDPGDPAGIWLFAVDTDFLGPQGLSGSLGGTRDNGTVTALICNGDSNINDFAPCSTASVGPGAGGFLLNVNHLATVDPYALAIGVGINLSGPGTSTGDFRVIPEPALLSLLGVGLAGLASRRRRARG